MSLFIVFENTVTPPAHFWKTKLFLSYRKSRSNKETVLFNKRVYIGVFVNFLSMHTVLLFILFNLLGLKRKKSCLTTRVARTTQASVLGEKSETVNLGPDVDELIILCSLHTFSFTSGKKQQYFFSPQSCFFNNAA